MTIKDFKQGQAVYVLCSGVNTEPAYKIDEYIVISVGRKYVKASSKKAPGFAIEFYQDSITDNYLYENKDWGNRKMLFLTREDTEGYIEKGRLRRWLSDVMNFRKNYKYSLVQLREVKKILEEE